MQDRRRRTEEAGAEVEAMMKVDPPLIQEAWYRLQGWYKAAVDCAPPPARGTLKRVTAERATLYSRVPPPGRHHTGHHRAICGGGWRPHGGGSGVGGKTPAKQPRRGAVKDDESVSTPHPRGVAPPSGVVQGGSGPPPTTRLSVAQAGGGARSTAALYHP